MNVNMQMSQTIRYRGKENDSTVIDTEGQTEYGRMHDRLPKLEILVIWNVSCLKKIVSKTPARKLKF